MQELENQTVETTQPVELPGKMVVNPVNGQEYQAVPFFHFRQRELLTPAPTQTVEEVDYKGRYPYFCS